jgi:AbiV family abortive infection protein
MAKSKRPLALFEGRLPPTKIAEGMNAAERNAKRLAQDARLLLEARRFATATAVAILAIEEAGKSHVLRGMSVAKTDEDVRRAWREYRSHTRKNVLWTLSDMVRYGARKLDDFGPMFDPESDHPYVLDQIKQLGFYTDCVGKGKWAEPEIVIEENLAKSLVETAERLASEHFVTPQEIELWVKHMGPVQGGSLAWFKKAFENYYAELQEKGLAPPGENMATQLIEGRIGPESSKSKSSDNK